MADDKELTPSWLTNEVLAEITSTKLKGRKVQVSSFEVKRAIPKGNNYVCDILRVKVHFSEDDCKESQSVSFIIKIPKTGGMTDMIHEMGIIDREEIIYKVVIPKLNGAFGGNDVFSAGCYDSPVPNVLIFDDLSSAGYQMAERRDLLSFEQSAAALKALARFHAASVWCHEEEPDLIESLKELLITEEYRKNKPEFIQMFVKNAGEGCKKWPELERFSDKFSQYNDTVWDLLLECMKIDSRNFQVLNHGDFWVTNMLFKYSDDDIDVKLIDFQLTKYNSPASDLTYFFYGSVHHDVVSAKYEDLLEIYLDELNRSLKLCGVDRMLHKEELKSYMTKFRIIALYSMVCLLPIVLNNDSGVFDISEMTEEEFKGEGGENFAKKYFENKFYVESLAKRLNEFEKLGWP